MSGSYRAADIDTQSMLSGFKDVRKGYDFIRSVS